MDYPEANYMEAVEQVRRERRPSASFVQRMLKIGYQQAAAIMERMEEEGICTKANHVGKREMIDQPSESDPA